MENFDKTIGNIKDTVGEENTALISNELVELSTEHQASLDSLHEKETEIAKLQQEKAELIKANSRMFLKLGKEEKEERFKESEKPQRIELSDILNHGKLMEK